MTKENKIKMKEIARQRAYDCLYDRASDVLKIANTLRSIVYREDTKDEIYQFKMKMKDHLKTIKNILKNYE